MKSLPCCSPRNRYSLQLPVKPQIVAFAFKQANLVSFRGDSSRNGGIVLDLDASICSTYYAVTRFNHF